MKYRLMPASLATQFHRPLRFGKVCRGHELPLRIVQIALILFLAVEGAKLIAFVVSNGVQGLIRLLT